MDQMEQVKKLSKLSNFKALLLFVGDWAVIALAVFGAVGSQNWAVYALAVIVIARQQHALALLVHEAVHWRLFTNRKLGDRVAQALGGSPILFSLHSFRWVHLRHHKNPLGKDDPDITLTGGYPIDRASFRRKMMRDLTGRTQWKFIRAFNVPLPATHTADEGRGFPRRASLLASYFLAQSILFALFCLFASPFDYLLLWLLPMFTILPATLRLRGIAEHAGYEPNEDQNQNTRTVVSPLSGFLSPHFGYYHREHHLYPSVPCYNLPQLFRVLRAERGGAAATDFRSYRSVLRELVRNRPQ